MNPLLKLKQDTGQTWKAIGYSLGVSRQRAEQLSRIGPHQVMNLPVSTIIACQLIGIEFIEWAEENKSTNKVK